MSDTVQGDPIQAQLIAARRNQILNAATKVFAEKGFHRATIKDVAKEAKIADGTIYNYFESKTALLLGILDRLNETPQRGEHLAQAEKMDFREWMTSYIKHRYEILQPEIIQVFQVLLPELLVNKELRERYFEQIVQPTYALAEQFFQQWVAEGVIRPVDPMLTLRVVAGTFLGLWMLRLIGDSELQTRWDELPAIITEIVLNGLGQGGSHDQSTEGEHHQS